MKSVFVDTAFWIARLDPKDQLFERAGQAAERLEDAWLVTTDAVIVEVLNFFAGTGSYLRTASANLTEDILTSAQIEVVYHGHGLLRAAVTFYRSRQDKGYSLTDCMSMLVMRDLYGEDDLQEKWT